MKGDGRLPTFYAYLGLFTFAMLGLVISTNLLQLYIFWELVRPRFIFTHRFLFL